MNTKHLSKLIQWNLFFCLLCPVQVQATTPIISPTDQQIRADEVPTGLSANDWATIQSQILADKYRHHSDQQHGYTSSNPAHGWNIHFTADGTTSLSPYNSTDKTYHLDMKLSAIGYKTLQSMDNPQQINSQNTTITYQWNNNLREWWINSDTQLEQWFSLAHKPAGATRGQPLTLQLSVDTDLKAVQAGDTLHFETPAGNTISYDKLKVWDVTGKHVPAHMKLAGNTLSLIVDDADASYPLTIDPSFQQEAYIKASIIDSFDNFGWSVAISGNTIVIGTPDDESSATGVNGDHNKDLFEAGAAYVFVRNKSGWSQQAYLKASNTDSSDAYGKSVAISGDTIVVGAFEEDSQSIGINGDQGNNNGFVHSGAVYVYTRNETIWSQVAYLKASNTEKFDNFGRSLAIDGDTIAVGAIGEDSNATGINGDQENNNTVNSGAVYVFTRDAGNWSQQAYLKASNPDEHALFGFSVAIDDDTIVVGARDGSDATGVNSDQINNNAPDSGAVYVFTREGSLWSQQAYLKSSNSEKGDRFGRVVAISGNTLVATATGEDSNSIGINSDENNNLAFNAGAAYVFLRKEASWIQQAYLKPADTSTTAGYFGNSVSISNNMVAVGSGSGAYIFYRTGINWNQIDQLKVETNTRSVSISGETVVVGTPSDDSNVTGVNGDQPGIGRSIDSGAAYVYQLDNITVDPLTPGSISGYVWLDNNADGLQAVNEPPFSGAISIALHQNLTHSINFNTEPIEVVTVDENGRFVFENLLRQNFSYHICTSTEYLLSGLSITTRNAGDDSIDSDFDVSSCAFAVINRSYDLGLIGQSIDPNQPTNPTNPVTGNQVKGFVWLDNNGDGLQNPGEPGLTQRAQGLGSTSIALYPEGSVVPVDVVFLDENSGGHYLFTDVVAGNYYICASSDFLGLGLTVTTRDAGDDAVDSDFDADPCAYNIIVSDTQGFDADLGLVGGPLNPTTNGNLNEITVKTNTLLINHQWQSANILGSSSAPVIFFSAPSNNGAQRGVVRMKRSDNRTQFKFQEWSNLDGAHTNETINIVSVPQGNWSAENTQIEVGRSDINGTGQWKTIPFATAFSTPPAVILSLQTANGGDAVDVHVRNITTESMQIALYEEERGMSSGHLTETVGYLLVSSDSNTFDLRNTDSTHIELPFQTTGLQVNHHWKTIGAGYQVRLEEDQTRDQETFHVNETVHVIKVNDFYLTQIASAVGGDPCVLRSRK